MNLETKPITREERFRAFVDKLQTDPVNKDLLAESQFATAPEFAVIERCLFNAFFSGTNRYDLTPERIHQCNIAIICLEGVIENAQVLKGIYKRELKKIEKAGAA